LNILEKFAEEVTGDTTNAGTDIRLEQPLNILLMLVTNPVLNNGTDWRLVQTLNIPLMLVTAAVLNRGTVVRP